MGFRRLSFVPARPVHLALNPFLPIITVGFCRCRPGVHAAFGRFCPVPSLSFCRRMSFLVIHVGDIVRLRKPHACGGWEWEVVRTGADIGIVCLTCKRRLLMPRDQFRKAVKRFVRVAADEPTTTPTDVPSDATDTSLPSVR